MSDGSQPTPTRMVPMSQRQRDTLAFVLGPPSPFPDREPFEFLRPLVAAFDAATPHNDEDDEWIAGYRCGLRDADRTNELDAAAAPADPPTADAWGKYDVTDRRMDDVPEHRTATRLPNVGVCPVCGRDECPGWTEDTDTEPDPNADCLLGSRLGKLLNLAVPADPPTDNTVSIPRKVADRAAAWVEVASANFDPAARSDARATADALRAALRVAAQTPHHEQP